MAMSTDKPETAASVNVGPISYRARCTEPGCKNLGRLIFIYADAGGRPIAHPVVCHAHARLKLACVRAAGLKVYDDRELSGASGGMNGEPCLHLSVKFGTYLGYLVFSGAVAYHPERR
jgi:hypothetical protein